MVIKKKKITKAVLKKREKRELKRESKERWKETRLKILIRDNYTCQMCLNDLKDKHPVSQAVHHMIPRQYKELFFDENNLILLCPFCHHFGKNAAHQNCLFFADWFSKKYPERYLYLMNHMGGYKK